MSTRDELALIADIGGTNARFALSNPNSAHPELLEQQSLRCAEFASLHHAAEHYLQRVGAKPTRAAIAVASPVKGDEVRFTNRAWEFSQAQLQRTLYLSHLSVINDFGAIAWAVTALREVDRQSLYGHELPNVGPISLIGPGTGLGVALLVGSADTGWLPIETEGGHVSFAPQNDEERLIADWVSAKFGRCSNERLLSGMGLSHIEAALRASETKTHKEAASIELREPEAIVNAALEGHDVLARRTLARFCAILGGVVGDTALVHGARAVVIAGGIVPRFVPFVRTSAFREKFLAKGRFADYLSEIPIHVITHAHPGLLGAAVALRQQRQNT